MVNKQQGRPVYLTFMISLTVYFLFGQEGLPAVGGARVCPVLSGQLWKCDPVLYDSNCGHISMQCAPQLDGLGDDDDDDIGGGKVDLDDQLQPFRRTGVLEAGGGRRVDVEAVQSRIDQLDDSTTTTYSPASEALHAWRTALEAAAPRRYLNEDHMGGVEAPNGKVLGRHGLRNDDYGGGRPSSSKCATNCFGSKSGWQLAIANPP